MKLLYAGFGVTEKPYTDLQFNCIRNAKCQRPYYVPVKQFSDIAFYVPDLQESPSLIEIEVMNVCDIANVGTAVSTSYVVGTKPDGTWYGVFGGLIVTPPIGVIYNRFFFKFTFTIGATEHVYYSEQYEFQLCEEFTFIRGCYPNETVGSDATDCNGIYYGFPNNEDYLGDLNYRYIHSGYVRMASIIEQRNKMTFTAFNSRRIYKGVFNREWLFEFELVPGFYKDHLVGIFNRGNVQVSGSEWKLADSQDISIVDNDSKLWKLDMIFDSECKQNFGCKPADCVLPVTPCCDPTFISATSEIIEECVEPGIGSGGTLPDGTVGIPYTHVINLTGTAPFSLTGITKPSWMTIAVVGSTIEFSGTPDTEENEVTVEFTVENCSVTTLPFNDLIDIFADDTENFAVDNNSTDVTINSVGPAFYLAIVGSFPLAPGAILTGTQGGYSGNISIGISTPSAGTRYAKLIVNGSQVDCFNFLFPGTYTFFGASFGPGDLVVIRVENTSC